MRSAHTIADTALALFLMGCGAALSFALGASATAMVSATILPPGHVSDDLVLIPKSISLRGLAVDAVSLVNRSDQWRSVRLEVTPQVSSRECGIHFSPKSSDIPPNGQQVIRFIKRPTATTASCPGPFTLEIKANRPGTTVKAISIPIHTDAG